MRRIITLIITLLCASFCFAFDEEENEIAALQQELASLKQDVQDLRAEAQSLFKEANGLVKTIKKEKKENQNNKAVTWLLWEKWQAIEQESDNYLKNPRDYDFDLKAMLQKGQTVVNYLKELAPEHPDVIAADNKLVQLQQFATNTP